MSEIFDIAIIGAGDIGAALARELARFELDVVLLDSGDVGAGTSKANTALLHVGFDCRPDTLEDRLVARGHRLLRDYSHEVGIPLERTGGLLVAWTEEERDLLPAVEAYGRGRGYTNLRRLRSDGVYRREPHLSPGALGAIEIPDESIICPWTPPLAFATQALLAGVQVRRYEHVSQLQRTRAGWELTTSRGFVRARWVINAAGLHSDEIHRMAGLGGFTVTPRRGELIVFDRLARSLVSHVIMPVPTARTKGVMIAPTVFGNVLLGPTADDVDDKRATDSTAEGLARLLTAARRLMPALLEHEITAVYAGLRAATEHDDYQLGVDAKRRYAFAGGIRSTGLTSAMAVAEWIRDGLSDAGLALRERPGGLPKIEVASIGEASRRAYMDAQRIAADPAYGEIICFCERVTLGEIRDAIRGPLPPRDLDGLRRRTRAMMGRCQGFYCSTRVAGELAASREADLGALWGRGR